MTAATTRRPAVERAAAERVAVELVVARDALRALAGDRGNEILQLLAELADAAVRPDEVSEDAEIELERRFKRTLVVAVAETMRPIFASRRAPARTRRARQPITAAAPVAAGATP